MERIHQRRCLECAVDLVTKCRTRRSPNSWISGALIDGTCLLRRVLQHRGIWTEEQVQGANAWNAFIRKGVLSVRSIWSQNVAHEGPPNSWISGALIDGTCLLRRVLQRRGIWTEDQVQGSSAWNAFIREGVLSVRSIWSQNVAHEGPQISWISGALRWWHLCVATNVLHPWNLD